MINKQNFLKGITDADEKMLFAKALDRAVVAEKTYRSEFTDFMDPYKAFQLADFLSKSDIKPVCFGGYEDSERLVVGFFPIFGTEEYTQDKAYFDLFPISAVEISYNSKYSRALTHRDFLGSVLGLGITRDKTGDIITEENRAVIFVKDDIADFICVNLEKVAHTSVKTKILQGYKPAPAKMCEKSFTVPSLRLDAVISDAFNMSRSKAAELIRGEKAFVNWHKEVSGSKQVSSGDMITLRGVGRVKLAQVVGKTKKDRILISTIIYK